MAIILYIWGFIVVPLIISSGYRSFDEREVYALHGGAALLAVFVYFFMSLRQSRSSRGTSHDVATCNDVINDDHDQDFVGYFHVSHYVDETKETSFQTVDTRDHDHNEDNNIFATSKTSRYVRGAIICATKVWSFVSFAWLCLLALSFVISIHTWYFIILGSLLLLVWLRGGLVSHPFPFSFFGFAMHIREWVQWRGLCLLLIVLMVVGDSGKVSIRFFVCITSILLLFWIVRLIISPIRRIRINKFRLFRLLTGVWFVLLAIICFQAFLFTRGHIIQSRQHMQTLMREYVVYQFISFVHDIQRESIIGSLIAHYDLSNLALSVRQDNRSNLGLSGSGGVDRSGNEHTDNIPTMGNSGNSDQFIVLSTKEKGSEFSISNAIPSIEPTFRNVLKFLLANYPKTTTRYTFVHVPLTDPDYPIFATARRLNMIGTDIQPDRIVVCQTFFVMQGLVGGWTVSGQGTIFDQYWNEARRRGVIGSCQWGKPVPQDLFSQ